MDVVCLTPLSAGPRLERPRRRRRNHATGLEARLARLGVFGPLVATLVLGFFSTSSWAAKELGLAEVLQKEIHQSIVEVSDQCLLSTSDTYQRFSGFVIKYHTSQLCEQIVTTFSTLDLLAASAAASDNAIGDYSPKALALVAAAQLQGVEHGIELMLQETNAAGDGGLMVALREHFQSLVGGLRLSAKERPDADADAWRSDVIAMVSILRQLATAALSQISHGVAYNVGGLNVSDLPRFLTLMEQFPASVPTEVVRVDVNGKDNACSDVMAVYNLRHVLDVNTDPESWRAHDVSGLLTSLPSAQKLLYTIAKTIPLSYSFVAVVPRSQVGSQELTAEYQSLFKGGQSAPASEQAAKLKCRGVGLAYDPTLCLFDLGWGSNLFSLNTEPPFDGVLAVSEMSKKAADDRPSPFVQPVANESASLDDLLENADSVYKSLNTPSPDVLFLSPMVGNCMALRKLGPSRRDGSVGGTPQLSPKLVYVPVNPLIPPPWEFAPNFSHRHQRILEQRKRGVRHTDSVWWFAQCSLTVAQAVMSEQGYTLLHLEHTFAVFVLRILRPSVQSLIESCGTADSSSREPSWYDHWLRGWHCSGIAPTLFGLERSSGAAGLSVLRDRQATTSGQQEALCAFARLHDLLPLAVGSCDTPEQAAETPVIRAPQSWRAWELQDSPEERGKAYMLESQGRGRCLHELGFCECFPPYRGRFCEAMEVGRFDDSRTYRAVLHCLVGDKDRLLNDMVRTLPLLYERFNERFDYPVLVFHDGLSPQSRQRLLEASQNRIWFAYVEDYTRVPAFLAGRLELSLGGYSTGYRAMCRFRSGTMFTQPVMSKFDYAWTLDTDGYLPAEIREDPFARMHRGNYAYAYSHISRDQASAVQHFWEHVRLYFSTQGVDPKSSKMMRRITDALVLRDTYWHEWNRVLFMNDIEITKVSWFAGHQYQDFFKFLDSIGGFWLYRWGDHAVRTIAIAQWMDTRLLMKMEVPYGHQETCRCGREHPDSVCVRPDGATWWRCLPRAEAASMAAAGKLSVKSLAGGAGGDVGTVHEDLMFGGE